MATVSFKEFSKSGNIAPVQTTTPEVQSPMKEGFLKDAWGDIKETGSAIKQTILSRADKQREIMNAQATGQQGKLSTGFQSATNLAGAVTGVIGDVFMGAGKAVLTQNKEEQLKQKTQEIGTKVMQMPEVQQWLKNFEDLKRSNPEMARNIEALGGFGSFLLEFAGLKAGAKGAEAAITTGKKLAAEGGQALATGVERVATGVGEAVSDVGGAIKRKAGDIIAEPIPAPVKEAIGGTTPARFEELAGALRAATLSNKAATPMELAGKKGEEALAKVKSEVNRVGQEKTALTSAMGNTDTGSIAKDARLALSENVEKLGLAIDKDGNFVTKVGRSARITSKSDLSLLRDVRRKLVELGDKPSFQQVDDAIDALQDMVYQRNANPLLVKSSTEVEAIVQQVVGELNNQLKEVAKNSGIKSYSILNEQFSKLNKVLSELNKKLGPQGERGGSLMKRVFSPSDARTKELFSEIKNITGIDLTNEATLAKFLMEVSGDARQKSLLEQLQLSQISTKRGALGWLLDKVRAKYDLPEAKIQRARELLKK